VIAAFTRIRTSMAAGTVGPAAESDLDALDHLLQQIEGRPLFGSSRAYEPLPLRGDHGAQWWACPRGICSGRGRVRPWQEPPRCGIDGRELPARAATDAP
jgi:hypothetical protein